MSTCRASLLSFVLPLFFRLPRFLPRCLSCSNTSPTGQLGCRSRGHQESPALAALGDHDQPQARPRLDCRGARRGVCGEDRGGARRDEARLRNLPRKRGRVARGEGVSCVCGERSKAYGVEHHKAVHFLTQEKKKCSGVEIGGHVLSKCSITTAISLYC